jgi:hypothetical protein
MTLRLDRKAKCCPWLLFSENLELEVFRALTNWVSRKLRDWFPLFMTLWSNLIRLLPKCGYKTSEGLIHIHSNKSFPHAVLITFMINFDYLLTFNLVNSWLKMCLAHSWLKMTFTKETKCRPDIFLGAIFFFKSTYSDF